MLYELGMILIIGSSLATIIGTLNGGKSFKLVYLIAPFVEKVK